MRWGETSGNVLPNEDGRNHKGFFFSKKGGGRGKNFGRGPMAKSQKGKSWKKKIEIERKGEK